MCVQSHQGLPRSAVVIVTCEDHACATDSHTVPTAANRFSMLLCCRLTWSYTLTSVNLSVYIIYSKFYRSLSNSADQVADSVCRTRCTQQQPNIVLSELLSLMHLLVKLQSNIPIFTLTIVIPLPLCGVCQSPSIEHWVAGTLKSHIFRKTVEICENNSRIRDWTAWQWFGTGSST